VFIIIIIKTPNAEHRQLCNCSEQYSIHKLTQADYCAILYSLAGWVYSGM